MRKKYKKIIIIVLSIICVYSFAGCTIMEEDSTKETSDSKKKQDEDANAINNANGAKDSKKSGVGSSSAKKKDSNKDGVIYDENGKRVIVDHQEKTTSSKKKSVIKKKIEEINPAENSFQISDNFKVPGYSDIVIAKLKSYTGYFYEDGTDKKVSGIISAVIKNNSKDTLEVCNLSMMVNDKKSIHFSATIIPPGEEVTVLEKNKAKYHSSDIYLYKNSEIIFNDKISPTSKKINMELQSGIIGACSTSGKKYGVVNIYYKNVDKNGNYLGGITYRTQLKNVGKEMEYNDAVHYDETSSEIVRIDCEN